MARLNVRGASLAVGATLSVVHVIGTLLSRYGVITAWMKLHFLDVSITLLPFDPSLFIVGILFAFSVGALLGGLLAWVYNHSIAALG